MKRFVRMNQYVLWFLFRVYLVCTRSHYKTLFNINDIEPNTAYVLAANHQRKLDPFIVGGGLPIRIYRKLVPVWFMGYRNLFKRWYLRWALRSFGSFPTKPIYDLPYGLPYSLQVLEAGGTINIFPEGKRTKPGATEPKRGVSVLTNLENVKLIPVHIDWQKKRVGKTVTIVYGKPQSAQGLSPEQIMDVIYSL